MTKGELFRQMQTVRTEIDILSRMLWEEEEDEDDEPVTQMPMEDPTGEYLSVQEVAKRYSVSPATIYRWARQGLFPTGTYWGPRTRRWKKAELEGCNGYPHRYEILSAPQDP